MQQPCNVARAFLLPFPHGKVAFLKACAGFLFYMRLYIDSCIYIYACLVPARNLLTCPNLPYDTCVHVLQCHILNLILLHYHCLCF